MAAVLAGPFSSECGTHAVATSTQSNYILEWSGTEWVPDEFSGRWFDRANGSNFQPAAALVTELTGDLSPDVGFEWVPADFSDAPRSFGAVMRLDADCNWGWHRFISHCLSGTVVEALSISSLSGDGYQGPCSGRAIFSFRWVADLGVFVGTLDDYRAQSSCPNDYEFAVDLPLMMCNEGIFVEVVQGALDGRNGIDLTVDGYFGPNTQLAVLYLQKERGLELTGIVDYDTWAAAVDGASLPYIDVNGDGVITPDEFPFD